METTLRDIRYGLRMLRKDLGFTVTAVVALMLGIASTTVIFSVIDGVLLRPLPYPDADRLVVPFGNGVPRTVSRVVRLRRRTFSTGPRKAMSSMPWWCRAAGRAI